MPKSNVNHEMAELLEHELYIHRAVGRGVAHKFFVEFENRQKAAEGGGVEFRFVDAVYFFAVSAAAGVIGNFAYAALASLVRRIRKPRTSSGEV